jgi:hypothetical protein
MKNTDLSLFDKESLQIIHQDFKEMVVFFENKIQDYIKHINDLKTDIEEIEKELEKRKNLKFFKNILRPFPI